MMRAPSQELLEQLLELSQRSSCKEVAKLGRRLSGPFKSDADIQDLLKSISEAQAAEQEQIDRLRSCLNAVNRWRQGASTQAKPHDAKMEARTATPVLRSQLRVDQDAAKAMRQEMEVTQGALQGDNEPLKDSLKNSQTDEEATQNLLEVAIDDMRRKSELVVKQLDCMTDDYQSLTQSCEYLLFARGDIVNEDKQDEDGAAPSEKAEQDKHDEFPSDFDFCFLSDHSPAALQPTRMPLMERISLAQSFNLDSDGTGKDANVNKKEEDFAKVVSEKAEQDNRDERPRDLDSDEMSTHAGSDSGASEPVTLQMPVPQVPPKPIHADNPYSTRRSCGSLGWTHPVQI